MHATLSTVSIATGAVLGKQRQCRLSAEDGKRVRPNQCKSVGDRLAKLSGSVSFFPTSVRFTLFQRFDGGPLVEFTTEQLSPVKCKLSGAFATDAETEQKLKTGPTKIKRHYNRKAKPTLIEGKSAADQTIKCANFVKQTILNVNRKFIK